MCSVFSCVLDEFDDDDDDNDNDDSSRECSVFALVWRLLFIYMNPRKRTLVAVH